MSKPWPDDDTCEAEALRWLLTSHQRRMLTAETLLLHTGSRQQKTEGAEMYKPWPGDTYELSVTFSAKSLEEASEKVDLLTDILDEHYPHWSAFLNSYEGNYPEEFTEDGKWIGPPGPIPTSPDKVKLARRTAPPVQSRLIGRFGGWLIGG